MIFLLKKKRTLNIGFLVLLVLVISLAPFHQARADLLDIGYSVVAKALLFFLQIFIKIIFYIISYLAQALDTVMQYSSSNYPDAIRQSWTIIRNIANLFFILGLVVMAFGTLFDNEKYGFSGGNISNFIIAALFINFSFAFGSYLVSLADGISHFFLNQIGQISVRLANGFNLGSLAFTDSPAAGVLSADAVSFQVMVAIIFLIIFFSITLLILLATFIALIARIVVIWGLLISSPLAWVSSIFPNLRDKVWSEWWSWFNSWAFFTPIYLFFLSFAFIILEAKPQNNQTVNLQTASAGQIFAAIFDFNDIIFYAVTILFMLGGMWAAFKIGGYSGNYAGATFTKIQNGIKRFSGYSAAKTGLKASYERVKEEGLPGKGKYIYGGAQAEKRKAARFERMFSGSLGMTPRFEDQKQQMSTVEEEVKRLKDLEANGKLRVDNNLMARAAKTNPNSVQGAALRSLLYERGITDGDDYVKSLKTWSRKNPLMAQSMTSKANKKSIDARDALGIIDSTGSYKDFAVAGATSSKVELIKSFKDNKKLLEDPGFNSSSVGKAIDLLGGSKSSEGDGFLKEIGKKRPDLVAQYNSGGVGVDVEMKKILSGMGGGDIADVLSIAWQDHEFFAALEDRIHEAQRISGPVAAGRGRKAKLGGGEILKNEIAKKLLNDPKMATKMAILNRITP